MLLLLWFILHLRPFLWSLKNGVLQSSYEIFTQPCSTDAMTAGWLPIGRCVRQFWRHLTAWLWAEKLLCFLSVAWMNKKKKNAHQHANKAWERAAQHREGLNTGYFGLTSKTAFCLPGTPIWCVCYDKSLVPWYNLNTMFKSTCGDECLLLCGLMFVLRCLLYKHLSPNYNI